MSDNGFASLRSGQAIPRGQIPERPMAEFRRAVVDAVARGHRVAALFGDAPASGGPVELYAVLADGTQALLRVVKTTLDADRFPSPDAGLPAGSSVRARDRRAIRCLSRRPSLVQAGSFPCLVPTRPRRLGQEAGRATSHRRHGLLPRRRGGDPRGSRRARPRRHHRAGAFPLPVPRRAGLPPGDFARLPASGGRAGARRRAEQAHHPHDGGGGRGHLGRPCHGLLPGGRGPGRLPGPRSAPRCCAASPWNWSDWPTTPGTWVPWRATWGSCRRLRTAGASAAISST